MNSTKIFYILAIIGNILPCNASVSHAHGTAGFKLGPSRLANPKEKADALRRADTRTHWAQMGRYGRYEGILHGTTPGALVPVSLVPTAPITGDSALRNVSNLGASSADGNQGCFSQTTSTPSTFDDDLATDDTAYTASRSNTPVLPQEAVAMLPAPSPEILPTPDSATSEDDTPAPTSNQPDLSAIYKRSPNPQSAQPNTATSNHPSAQHLPILLVRAGQSTGTPHTSTPYKIGPFGIKATVVTPYQSRDPLHIVFSRANRPAKKPSHADWELRDNGSLVRSFGSKEASFYF